MSTIIYIAICIVSLAIIIYAALFLFLFLGMLIEYIRDEVSSDPVSRLFCFLIVGLFTVGTVLYFLGF